MLGAVSEACLCKRQAGARAIDAKQVRLAHAFGKTRPSVRNIPAKRRIFASLLEIQELWRAVGDVVDDEIRHDLHMAAEKANVVPGAEARVDLRVIDGIEAGIGAVDRPEEWQQMNATEQAAERPVQQIVEAHPARRRRSDRRTQSAGPGSSCTKPIIQLPVNTVRGEDICARLYLCSPQRFFAA